MAVTTAALSGSIKDLGLEIPDHYLARVVLVVESNTPGSLLRDTSGNTLLAGAKRVTVDKTTGAFSQTLVTTDSADIAPADDRLYKATLIYPSGKPGAKNELVSSGWFPFTADASLADVWQGIEVTAVSTALYESISMSVASAEASAVASAAGAQSSAASATLAQTLVTADLGTTDGQSWALVTDPNSLTGDYLRDTFGAANLTGQDRRIGDPQHEDGTLYTYPTRLDFGTVSPAPTAVPPGHKGVDIIAHWYNDFGLDHTADGAAEANGWYGWYDWRWNFPTNTGDGITAVGYDPARHPLQGFYQGDNATVLDWQCYWLASAGVTAVNLDPGAAFSSTGWATASNSRHWLYQLFHNVPNFRSLNYILGLKYDGTTGAIEAQNDDVVDTYATYPGAHTYTEDGKTYAAVWIWDLEALRGVYDAYVGDTLTVAWLKGLATKFRAIGYDGVCVLARAIGATVDDTLKDAGVLLLDAGYETRYGNDTTDYANSYADYAATAPFSTAANHVVNVVTAADSVHPHPSGWNLPGSTPALFRQVLARAVDSVVKNGQRRMVTIYNVSEWAEGGASLLPSVEHGFGYLDAIRSAPVAPLMRSTAPGVPHQFSAYNSYGTGVPTSTWTDACFTVEGVDFGGFHTGDVAAVTIPAELGGTYLVVATGALTFNAAGTRVLELRNGGAAISTAGWAGSDANQGQCIYLGPLAGGDVLTVALWQDSGSDVAQTSGTKLSLVRLGN